MHSSASLSRDGVVSHFANSLDSRFHVRSPASGMHSHCSRSYTIESGPALARLSSFRVTTTTFGSGQLRRADRAVSQREPSQRECEWSEVKPEKAKIFATIAYRGSAEHRLSHFHFSARCYSLPSSACLACAWCFMSPHSIRLQLRRRSAFLFSVQSVFSFRHPPNVERPAKEEKRRARAGGGRERE